MHDTVIVLSYHVDSDGTLTRECADRVDKGIDLYNARIVKTITTSGGYAANSNVPDTAKKTEIEILKKPIERSHIKGNFTQKPSQAEAMKHYAIVKGVPEEEIYTEGQSLDTVGQAILTRLKVAEPNNLGDILVVSVASHMDRVRTIFDFIYGSNFKLGYGQVPNSPEIWTPGVPISELNGINTFKKTFEGVSSGNIDQIVNALLERHPWYKDFKI